MAITPTIQKGSPTPSEKCEPLALTRRRGVITVFFETVGSRYKGYFQGTEKYLGYLCSNNISFYLILQHNIINIYVYS